MLGARPQALLAALAVGALALAGCGSSSSSSTAISTSGQSPGETAAAKATKAAEAKAPKGASSVLRQIYRQFPAPKPETQERSAAKAIAAGEKACRGKVPLEVKEEFFSAARARLDAEQEKMIARIATFESHSPTDASFTAGQLAADAYAATLPEATGQYGYQGCVYALARGLERRLAP